MKMVGFLMVLNMGDNFAIFGIGLYLPTKINWHG